jgi:hypothetical protein
MALDIGARELIVGLRNTTSARQHTGADRLSALNQSWRNRSGCLAIAFPPNN